MNPSDPGLKERIFPGADCNSEPSSGRDCAPEPSTCSQEQLAGRPPPLLADVFELSQSLHAEVPGPLSLPQDSDLCRPFSSVAAVILRVGGGASEEWGMQKRFGRNGGRGMRRTMERGKGFQAR